MTNASVRVVDISQVTRACERFSQSSWLLAFAAGAAALQLIFVKIEEGSLELILGAPSLFFLAAFLVPPLIATWTINLPRHFYRGVPMLLVMLVVNSLLLVFAAAPGTPWLLHQYLPFHAALSAAAVGLALIGMRSLAAVRSTSQDNPLLEFWHHWERAYQHRKLSPFMRVKMLLRVWRPRLARLFCRMGVIGLLLLFAALLIFAAMRFEPTDPFTLIAGLVAVWLSGWLVARLLRWLLVKIEELSALSASLAMRSDPRLPGVFIRSFLDDRVSTTSGLFGLFDDQRLEEWLAVELTGYGPLVAIGSGPEASSRGGASRDYFADSEWKGAIRDWMSRAYVVVALVGETPGFEWELREALRNRGSDALLLVFPPRPAEERLRLLQRVRASFLEATPGSKVPDFEANYVIGLHVPTVGNALAIVSRSASGLDYRLAIRSLMGHHLSRRPHASTN